MTLLLVFFPSNYRNFYQQKKSIYLIFFNLNESEVSRKNLYCLCYILQLQKPCIAIQEPACNLISYCQFKEQFCLVAEIHLAINVIKLFCTFLCHFRSKLNARKFQLDYTSLNDPYKDQFKAKQIYDKEKELAIKNPNSFKPNDHQKSVKHSEFEHMKEYNDKVYKTRNSAGNVITQARNFLTNPAKKGLGRTTINNLFSQIEYIPDPYDRQDEIDRKERIQHKSKQLPGTTRFITTSCGNRPFTADGILLDGAGYTIYKKPPIYKGNPFRPSNSNKKGFQGTFEVLQYMEEGGPDTINDLILFKFQLINLAAKI